MKQQRFHGSFQRANATALFLMIALGACSGGKGSDNGDTSSSGGAAGTAGGGVAGATVSSGGTHIHIETAGATGEEEQAGSGPTCGSSKLTAAPPQVNILLVIDKSSSMQNSSGFSTSKWQAMHDALEGALTQTKDRVSFGLSFFPFADDPDTTPDTCQTPTASAPLIPIADGADSVPNILDALNTYEPAGGTPTSAALTLAREYFTKGAGKDLTGTSYVLLATDGGPNCNAALTCDAASCTLNMEGFDCGGSCCDPAKDPDGPKSCLDDAASESAVRDLAKAGIKTFVVGIPGSELYHDTLDQLANAGLEPQSGGDSAYYAVTAGGGTQGLTDVLTQITTSVITTCELQLGSTPPDLNQLNVEIDGTVIPKLGDDGWDIDTTTSPPTLDLKGATCEMMKTKGAQAVDVTFGCPTVEVPR